MVLTYSGQSTSELNYNDTKESRCCLEGPEQYRRQRCCRDEWHPAGWVVEFWRAGEDRRVGDHRRLWKEREADHRRDGGAAGDKMVLTYSGQSTAELNYNDTKENVAAALKA